MNQAINLRITHPDVNLPIILVPAIVVRQIGTTSCNSASKTLAPATSVSHASLIDIETECNAPVEVLASSDGNKGISICEI